MQHVKNAIGWNAMKLLKMHKNAYGKKPHHIREKTPLIPGYLSYPRFRLSSLCQLHRSLGSRHRSYLGPSPKVTESSHLNPMFHSNRYSDLTASPRRRRCEFI